MAEYHLDAPRPDLLFVRLPRVFSEAGTRELLDQLARPLKAGRAHALVLATPRGFCVQAEPRRVAIDWMRAHHDALSAHRVATAMVFPGAVGRFFVSAFLLAAPLPGAYAVFEDDDSALRWAGEQLDARRSAAA